MCPVQKWSRFGRDKVFYKSEKMSGQTIWLVHKKKVALFNLIMAARSSEFAAFRKLWAYSVQ